MILEDRKTGCSFFDPMFFISYMDAVKKSKKKDSTAIEKSNVWKWIKKQKIFASRYVFVPICQRYITKPKNYKLFYCFECTNYKNVGFII